MSEELYPDWMLVQMGKLPKEVADALSPRCEVCGHLKGNNLRLTRRTCLNPMCYEHIKYLADDMVKKFGFKNIGPETCFNILFTHQLKNHFQILPYISNQKPEAYLHEIAEVAGVPGMRKKWEELLSGFRSFKEYFEFGFPPLELRKYASLLIEAEDYFTVKKPLARRSIEVMLNGSVPGYGNRDSFISHCNDVIGHLIRIKQVGVKQTADYCVTENKLSLDRKVVVARENGIPIVSSDEFVKLVYLKAMDYLN